MPPRNGLLAFLLCFAGIGEAARQTCRRRLPVVEGEFQVNRSLSELDAQGVLSTVLAAEQRCVQYLAAVENNTDHSAMTALADCYAHGYVKGVPLSADLAMLWCNRAAEVRKSQRPKEIFFPTSTKKDRALLSRVREAAASGVSGLPAIAAALAANPTYSELVTLAAASISRMASSPRARAAIIKSGVLPPLAAALAAMTSDNVVVSAVSVAISIIIQPDGQPPSSATAEAVVGAGFVEPLIEGLAAHAMEERVVRDVLGVLRACLAHPSATAEFFAVGATLPLVTVLTTFRDHERIPLGAIIILAYMFNIADSADICSAAAASRAFSPIAAFLSHATVVRNVDILYQGVGALQGLARLAVIDDDALVRLINTVEPLKAALVAHLSDARVVALISNTFLAVLRQRRTIGPVISSGVPAVLNSAIRLHLKRPAADQRVTDEALTTMCRILSNLVSDDGEENAAAVATSGSISAIVAVIRARFAAAVISESAIITLWNLARRSSLVEQIVDAGAVPALAAAMSAGLQNTAIVTHASYTLRALFENSQEARMEAEDAHFVALLGEAIYQHGTESDAGKAAAAASTVLLFLN